MKDNYRKQTRKPSHQNTDENIGGFFLPGEHYDPRLEKNILATIISHRDGYTRTVGYLEPDFFYLPHHREVFDCLKELFEGGWGLDVSTLHQALRRKGIAEMDGYKTFLFLDQLISGREYIVMEPHLEQWCVILRELYINRELTRIQKSSAEGGDAVARAIQTKELLGKALSINVLDDWRDLSQIMIAVDAHRNKVKGKELLGVPTSIKTLDMLTAGLQATQLIVIGARPSVGKSAFATGIAMSAAKKGYKVGIISLEMPEEQIGSRMASIYTDIEFWRIYRNRHTDANEEQRLMEGMSNMAGLPIYITDKTNTTGTAIRAKAERLLKTKGLDLLLIDYLQLIEAEGSGGSTREREVAKLSRSLKVMAMDLKIPVVILCQLNRDSEKTGTASKKPRMSQIRESGAIEQDADVVILLDYPYKRGETTDENGASTQGKASIILEKNRNGETMDIPISFTPELMKFHEPDPDDLLRPAPQEQKAFSNGIQSAGIAAIQNNKPGEWTDEEPF